LCAGSKRISWYTTPCAEYRDQMGEMAGELGFSSDLRGFQHCQVGRSPVVSERSLLKKADGCAERGVMLD
jgi:hypothetical protein